MTGLLFVNKAKGSAEVMHKLFSAFHTSVKSMKPYKIQNVDSSTKVGITAKSFLDLQNKCSKKFKIPVKILKVVLAEDGTEIDDDEYFSYLPPQTLFVALKPGQEWHDEQNYSPEKLKSVLQAFFESSKDQRDIVTELQELMAKETSPALREVVGKLTSSVEMNTEASTRKEDPDWFNGVENRFKTKEDVMKDRARGRVRSYLYTAKDHIKDHGKGEVFTQLEMLLKEYEGLLKENDYYSDYFCRTSESPAKLCDNEGWFQCEGVYNEESCSRSDHYINPYGSAEARLLFSTWNLDHRIEKSREVLPQLVAAASGLRNTKRKLNERYFFDLLFTRKNLKLVHIACHDKREHTTAKCNPKEFYKK